MTNWAVVSLLATLGTVVALPDLAAPAPRSTPVVAELRVFEDPGIAWIGIQNVSELPLTVCISGGFLSVESSTVETSAGLVESVTHGTPCGHTDSWHLVLPQERYLTLRSYLPAKASQRR
jgi:hypothetical protein